MFLLLGKFDVVGQLPHVAVNQGAGVPVGAQEFKQIHEFTLAASDHGGENLETGALRHGEQGVNHLLRGLRAHRFAAHRAMGLSGTREQQSQIVVDLGDGAYRRSGVAVRGFLVNRHRRAQTFDEIDIRLVHPPQKLPRVGA